MSEQLLHELRSARPVAPSALRERVRALSVQEPATEPFLARLGLLQWRRLVLVAPATVAVALVAAGVIGLTRGDVGDGADEQAAVGLSESAPPTATFDADTKAAAPERQALTPPVAGDASGAAVPPAPGQLQRYEAELRLRVDDVEALSSATKRAQRIALAHGGSVASLQYDAPAEGVGAAQITLRIPTTKVQSALAELSALGTIVGQRYGIDDLQQQADTLQREIEATQRRIAAILEQLESPNLSDADRAVLRSRLSNSRAELTRLRQGLSSTRAEARTATIYLTLTTEEIEPGAVGGGSRLDGVKDVLAWEAIALLYAAVVLGPFILVGLLVWLVLRLRRRQVEARLLEQN
jgi:Domain of unknown function (DUF4349)